MSLTASNKKTPTATKTATVILIELFGYLPAMVPEKGSVLDIGYFVSSSYPRRHEALVQGGASSIPISDMLNEFWRISTSVGR